MADASTFHGYGPEQGYSFLAEKIAQFDYRLRGIQIDVDEIFISDGAKSDTGNIGDILSVANKVAVTDPVYPVYVDTNVMAGRAGVLDASGKWSNLIYLPCTAENGFVPALPESVPDVIYLCYPNNPTGTTLTRDQLKVWVDYALKMVRSSSLILLTKHSSPMRMCLIPFMRLREQGNVQLSSAVSQRLPVSLAYVVPILSFLRNSQALRLKASGLS
jgi:aspartate/methionine/tyrosine aminotransferase